MALRGFPIIVSSPSGGGKTTVCSRVLAEDSSVERVVTATTRAPRAAEEDGIDYHFWPEARFVRNIKAGLMAEWAKVHGKYYYGIPKKSFDSIIRRGKNPLLVIDVQGAETVSRHYENAVKIFLLPPSWAVLKSRLEARNDTGDLAVRLATAKSELERIGDYHYVIINDDLEIAVSQLKAIITAQRIITARQLPRLKRSAQSVYRFI
ncbi:MAG: guanylate kinase [Elusimicrobiaceae bacterium]|nr:guanylate kinase [Elusimicrobiaceae bacterium]